MQRKKQEYKDAKPSPKTGDPVSSSSLPALQLQRYQFSDSLTNILTKLTRYDSPTFYQISINELKFGCQVELQRLQQLKAKDKNARNRQIDNELSLIVIGNQVQALIDERKEAEELLSKIGSSKNKKGQTDSDQTRENLIIRKYQGITGEIQKNQAEIRKFMDSLTPNRQPINFVSCFKFFSAQANKLKKYANQKLIVSRINLIQTLIFFLRETVSRWQPQLSQQLTENEGGVAIDADGVIHISLESGNKQNAEYAAHQILTFQQINKWGRFSSKSLQDKMIQLSGICQQIPQLQIFNRTLQFSQLSNREKVAFLRVVDVLISLHHRVSYLSRNKPQLLNELQIAQQQIAFINNATQIFLLQMEGDTEQILPVNFQGFDQSKKSQLTQSFIDLKHYIHKLSQIIVSQDQLHSQIFDRINSIVAIVHLYSRVALGDSEALQEWEELISALQKQDQPFSDQERNILTVLQKSIEDQRKKLNSLISQSGADNGLATKTNQQLEEEVNKLIEDYERLKAQNKNLVDNLDDLSRGRDELLLQIEERDIIIKNLSTIKFTLEKKLANQDATSNHSNKTQSEKEKLLQLIQLQREKYLKTYQALSKIKPQKERLQIQIESLKDRIESLKNDNLRQINRFNKQIQDLNNDKSLLQIQLDTAQNNQLKLLERLQISQRKNSEFSKHIVHKLQEDQTEVTEGHSELDLERLKKELSLLKLQLAEHKNEALSLREQNISLKQKLKDLRLQLQNSSQKQQELAQARNKIDKLNIRIRNLQNLLQKSEQRGRKDSQTKVKPSEQREEGQSILIRADKQVQTSINNITTSQPRYDYFFDIKQYERLLAEYNELRASTNSTIESLQRSLQQSEQLKISMESKIKRYESEAQRRPTYHSKNDSQEIANLRRQLEQKQRQNALLNDKLRKQIQQKNNISRNAYSQKQPLVQQINHLRQELNSIKIQLLQAQKDKETAQQKLAQNQKNKFLSQEALSRQITYLKGQLQQYQQKIRLLEQDNFNLHRQLTDQPNLPDPQLINQLEERYKANIQLTRQNEELRLLLQTQSKKITEHFQRQIYLIINERDTINNRLVAQITQLKQEVQNISATKTALSPEQQEKLSKWQDREIFISEILQHNQQLTQQNQFYSIKITQIQNDIQIYINQNQQIFLENQHIKQDAANLSQYIDKLKQQYQTKYQQWQSTQKNLNLQITNLIRQKDSLASQNSSIRLQLSQKINRITQLEAEINTLQIQITAANSSSQNTNLQYYLQKIKVLEQALQAIGAELNHCKIQIQRLEQQNFALKHQIDNRIPQTLLAQNNQLKTDIQKLIANQGQWIQKQRSYLQQLQSMSNELVILKETVYKGQVSSLAQSSKTQNTPHNLGAQQLPKNNVVVQQQKQRLLNSVSQIIEVFRRWQNFKLVSQLQNWGAPAEFIQQIDAVLKCLMDLCHFSSVLREEYIRYSSLNLQNFIQYVVRILSVFSQVDLASPEAAAFRAQIINISNSYPGGLFYTVLEEYTIHILQNHAIEKYRRQMQIKAQQLQEAKKHLQQAIAIKLKYEQQLLNHPAYSQRQTHVHQDISVSVYQQSNVQYRQSP